MIKTIFGLLGFLFIAYPVSAIETPTLISPANNSTVTSIPTFSWQAIAGSIGYNILIDDEPTVTSPYAKNPYYPANPSYSPQTLNPGTYYWKVKVKDSGGTYGNFSNIWSFTLTSSNPTPTPTPSSSPTSAPSSSPTSTPSSSSFTISNSPSEINSDQSFTILVDLSLPNNPNTSFYLKGAFKKADGSNYFGLTKVSGSWVKNSSAYQNQHPITTDSSGNWSGNLEIQPDSEDSGFAGSGDYIFKVGRYTSSGLGPTWSNEQNMKINVAAVNFANEEIGVINLSGVSSFPKSQVLAKSTATPQTSTEAYSLEKYVKESSKSASIAGTEISSVKSQKQLSPFIIVGVIAILGGLGSLVYIFYQFRVKS